MVRVHALIGRRMFFLSLLSVLLSVVFLSVIANPAVLAQGGGGRDNGTFESEVPPGDTIQKTDICGNPLPDVPGVDVPVVDSGPDPQCECQTETLTADDNCTLLKYAEIGINILTGIAGLAIVGGIMTGGFMYMTARDNPGQTAAGRERVIWALAALLMLIFFWGFLQWLVPGGVLDNVGGSQFENPT